MSDKESEDMLPPHGSMSTPVSVVGRVTEGEAIPHSAMAARTIGHA